MTELGMKKNWGRSQVGINSTFNGVYLKFVWKDILD